MTATNMTDSASEGLLPCPCGETPTHGDHRNDEGEGYGYVECHERGLSIVVHAKTEAEAIAAWNTRATPPVEMVERAIAATLDELDKEARDGAALWEPGAYRDMASRRLARDALAAAPLPDERVRVAKEALTEALAFVEEVERREDTHYLVGGHISDALASLDEGEGR